MCRLASPSCCFCCTPLQRRREILTVTPPSSTSTGFLDTELPRNEHVFEPKEKWSLGPLEGEPVETPFLCRNISVEDLPFVEATLIKEVALGFKTGPRTDAQVLQQLGCRLVRGFLEMAERTKWVRKSGTRFGPTLE